MIKKGIDGMNFPSEKQVEELREMYPEGTRIELVRMDDPQAPPVGTEGTVRGVDDAGSIMVRWDNGSGLSVAFGEDEIKLAKIRVLRVDPGEVPKIVKIEETFKSLQKQVDGCFEVIYPWGKGVALVCNDEGKINGMDLNRALWNNGMVYDIVAGPFLVVGAPSDSEHFCSLTEEQTEKYKALFRYPEFFERREDGSIEVISYSQNEASRPENISVEDYQIYQAVRDALICVDVIDMALDNNIPIDRVGADYITKRFLKEEDYTLSEYDQKMDLLKEYAMKHQKINEPYVSVPTLPDGMVADAMYEIYKGVRKSLLMEDFRNLADSIGRKFSENELSSLTDSLMNNYDQTISMEAQQEITVIGYLKVIDAMKALNAERDELDNE